MEGQQKTLINISTATLFKIAGVLILFWFFYIIRDIIAILFASLIAAAVIDPIADWCEKRRIPRTVGVLAIYSAMLGAFIAVVVLLVPPLASQMTEFISTLTRLLSKSVQQLATLREFGERYGVLDNIER